MATLVYDGFNNIPATDIRIDPSGYNTAEYTFDNKGNDFEILTGAQLNARLPEGLTGSFNESQNYVVYTGDFTKGQKNNLGGFTLTFENKAQDALGNEYDVKVDYVNVVEEPMSDYAPDFIAVTWLRTYLTDVSASNQISGTGSRVAGGVSEIEISVLGAEGRTTTLAYIDIDTEDAYNRAVGTPSDTGNGYRAGNGKVWEYQESVGPNTNGDVYAGPNTCEILDENTGFVGNSCSGDLTDNLVSSIAFNVTLPHTVRIAGSSGAINLFSDFTTLRSAKITASKIGEGSITEEGEKDYLIGSNATYTMTPSEGYRVKDVKVDGQSVGAVMEYTFTDIQEDHTIEVEFEKIPVEYTITATSGDGGSISSPGETTVQEGGSKTYTMTPNEGYEIDDVKVDGESVGKVATYTFSDVSADHTIEVTYKKKPGYTITTTVQGSGTVKMDGESAVGTKDVPAGSTKTLKIQPSTGHKIVSITVDGESVPPSKTLTFADIEEDHTVLVVFRKCNEQDLKPDVCGGQGPYIDPPYTPEPGDCCDGLQEQIDDLYATKQDVLTAGTNIRIENGVISATFDASIFVIVTELPEEGDENKVYLVPKQGGGFKEWHFHDGQWDEIGDYDIDLSNYYNKSEVDALIDDFLTDNDITKQYLLSKLGYTEIPYTVTDCYGNIVELSVLAKYVDPPQERWWTFMVWTDVDDSIPIQTCDYFESLDSTLPTPIRLTAGDEVRIVVNGPHPSEDVASVQWDTDHFDADFGGTLHAHLYTDNGQQSGRVVRARLFACGGFDSPGRLVADSVRLEYYR